MSRQLNAFLMAFAVAVSAGMACGGGGGGGGGTTPSPTPTPTPTPTNPCGAALTSGEADEVGAGLAPPATPGKSGGFRDSVSPWGVLDSIWAHNTAVRRGLIGPLTLNALADDVGEIAVLQDNGDLVLTPNRFDLHGIGLRFTRSGGGYNVARLDGAFRASLGGALTLTDDDTREVAVPFSFGYYGRTYGSVFINSDGNLTFEESDTASSDRNLSRFLTGVPRIAPFFADLDPSAPGGRIHANAAADGLTVTWCNVRGFESQRIATVQVTLLPDGGIEMRFGDSTNVFDAIVGLSPGRTGDFQSVDLSAGNITGTPEHAIGERYAMRGELDLVAVGRRFYSTHGDLFDQLVIWTDERLLGQGSFAFESNVANEVRGIGLPLFDSSGDFGSAGRLRSIVMMDALEKYPDNPTQRFLGENNTLSILGQESGHRWLAFVNFRDHTGQRSRRLLGRDDSHWNFFFDSDASVMEGNDIEDLGGGSFRTVGAVQRFGPLDLYAMGYLPESQVPTVFYVADPANMSQNKQNDSDPQVGITFNGTRRDVLVQDIIAIHGARVPPAAQADKVHRQAFIYVVGRGRTADAAQVAKLDRIRQQWEPFFVQATGARGRAETRLRPPT
jgi:hypothetical protein